MASDRVLRQSLERPATTYNGFVMLLVGLGLIVLGAVGALNAPVHPWGIVLLIVAGVALLLVSCGFYLLQPNQAAAILLPLVLAGVVAVLRGVRVAGRRGSWWSTAPVPARSSRMPHTPRPVSRRCWCTHWRPIAVRR